MLRCQDHPKSSLFSWSIPNPPAKPRRTNRRRPQPHPDTPKSKFSALPQTQRLLVTKGSFLSSPHAAAPPREPAGNFGRFSCVNGQCWAGIWGRGVWDLLTRYSLSCPWMVSRCTRVQVRAMAVLFKTLILTSVGAALGSG